MPRSSTGKWVQRAASTGGGRTYRGQRPVNWYGALIVIAILGLLSVALARHEYQNNQNASSAPKVQPAVGTEWVSAEGFDICGVVKAALPVPVPASTTGMTVDGKGVIIIKPTKSSQAGNNAVLSQLVDGYHGLTLTSSTLGYPGEHVYSNGDKCPKGTPDAGKVGTVQVGYYASPDAPLQRIADPLTLKPANESEVKMNFLPAGATLSRPNGAAVEDLLKAAEAANAANAAASTTTTTSPASTVPISSVPQASSTTTTAPAATTTTTPAATTTTK